MFYIVFLVLILLYLLQSFEESYSDSHYHHDNHYTRKLFYAPESIYEYIHDDSRNKILIFCDDDNFYIYIDPDLWNKYKTKIIRHIPEPIPQIFLQTGPTCGLYAMKMVKPTLCVPTLLEKAQSLGMSAKGEMFCAHEWASLARMFGLDANVVPIDKIKSLFESKRNGVAAIPYDADMSGISFRNGANSHWCIVWKLWSIDNEPMVFLTHSSCPHGMVEKWNELLLSNKQLVQSTVRVDHTHMHLLEAKCLADSAVWINMD